MTSRDATPFSFECIPCRLEFEADLGWLEENVPVLCSGCGSIVVDSPDLPLDASFDRLFHTPRSSLAV